MGAPDKLDSARLDSLHRFPFIVLRVAHAFGLTTYLLRVVLGVDRLLVVSIAAVIVMAGGS